MRGEKKQWLLLQRLKNHRHCCSFPSNSVHLFSSKSLGQRAQFSSDRRMAKDEEFKLVKIQVRLSLSLSAWGARVRAEQLLLFEDSPRRLS
jgi:hypothetical protein